MCEAFTDLSIVGVDLYFDWERPKNPFDGFHTGCLALNWRTALLS